MLPRFTKLFIAVAVGLIFLCSLFVIHPPVRSYVDPWTSSVFGEDGVQANHALHVAAEKGDVIMPKLGNATAKAELGRASWKLLHTMTLRFPENPTEDQRHALDSYFHLFSRLYPCGECAKEFQELLQKYPPQTSSRKAASLWLCFVHNLVNTRLRKPEFDCLKLDTYDCGCGPESAGGETATGEISIQTAPSDRLTGIKVVKGG